MRYYVYAYKDPDTGQIFYIGKGQGERHNTHLEKRVKNLPLHNSDLATKIDEILQRGKKPLIDIVAHFEDESDAYTFERKLIEDIGLELLTNKINTPWPPVMPADVIAKRAQTCRNNPKWRETMRSKEYKEKLSRAVKKAIEDRGGRPPLSDAHKAAVSRGCKGKMVGVKNPGAKNNPEQIYSYLEMIMHGVHWRKAAKELGIANAFNVMHRRAWGHIAAPIGYSPPTYTRKKDLDQETKNKILELYEAGLTQKAIAKAVGYSATSVSKVIKNA